jgi:hypothetical protein
MAKTLTFTGTITFNSITGDEMTPVQWADWIASFVPSAPFRLDDGDVIVDVKDWGMTNETITEK